MICGSQRAQRGLDHEKLDPSENGRWWAGVEIFEGEWYVRF